MKLGPARRLVRQLRENGTGIYNQTNGLILLPFEMRFLARNKPPERWVIDLSKDDHRLVYPENYFSIPSPEDRLFINEYHLPLFREMGWEKNVPASLR